MDTVNHQVRLAARPTGLPTASSWAHTEEPAKEPGDGQILVRVSHLSVDPAMRGWMNDQPSYLPPVGLNEVMRALGAGEVIASRHPDFTVGDQVTGAFGVQEYALSDGDGVLNVDGTAAELPTYLSALGMTGMTAYFGLFDVGRLKEGDTVLVSGAAGAVGSIVGQLAKIKGCRVVGIAGGADKCAWLTGELGFDAALDYRQDALGRRLREATPDGVNVFFDNVGGPVLDAGLARLARGARVVLCGAISQYNSATVAGPSNYLSLLVNRARMEGFIVFDYADRYANAAAEMAGWLKAGQLRSREDVVTGTVADFPDTLLKLFHGENTGKLVLRIR
jgi:NADPH-dependent curcumin reductase CurA